MRAMAEASSGSDAQKAADVAEVLGKGSQQVAPLRARLINKAAGSPGYGYAKFTVPQFDRFMRRHMDLDADAPPSPERAWAKPAETHFEGAQVRAGLAASRRAVRRPLAASAACPDATSNAGRSQSNRSAILRRRRVRTRRGRESMVPFSIQSGIRLNSRQNEVERGNRLRSRACEHVLCRCGVSRYSVTGRSSWRRHAGSADSLRTINPYAGAMHVAEHATSLGHVVRHGSGISPRASAHWREGRCPVTHCRLPAASPGGGIPQPWGRGDPVRRASLQYRFGRPT